MRSLATKPFRRGRGFTLIELMVSVAIVGVLSTVAMPGYQNMTLRTRKSERDVVMTSVKRSVSSVLVRDGRFAADYAGPQNPPGDPTTTRRPLDVTSSGMAVWRTLDLGIDGAVYHSYSFVAVGTEFTIEAVGNLDGDSVPQRKLERYAIREGALLPTALNPVEYIPAGDLAF